MMSLVHCSQCDKTGTFKIEIKVTPKIELILEFNNLLHKSIEYEDVSDYSGPEKLLRKAGGEINIGLNFLYTPKLVLRFDFKDLSKRYSKSGNRTFTIIYFEEF